MHGPGDHRGHYARRSGIGTYQKTTFFIFKYQANGFAAANPNKPPIIMIKTSHGNLPKRLLRTDGLHAIIELVPALDTERLVPIPLPNRVSSVVSSFRNGPQIRHAGLQRQSYS